MPSVPPARSEHASAVLVDRGIVRLSWIAFLCVAAAVAALLLQRPMLVFVLAITGIGVASTARKRAGRRVGKGGRWAGANRSLLAFIGGIVVMVISLPALLFGLIGTWQFG